jgi:hypothetical protein
LADRDHAVISGSDGWLRLWRLFHPLKGGRTDGSMGHAIRSVFTLSLLAIPAKAGIQ